LQGRTQVDEEKGLELEKEKVIASPKLCFLAKEFDELIG